MIQKKYLFHDFDALVKIVDEIKDSENYKTASGVLLQLYNPKVDSDDDKIVKYINDNCSNACLIGLTCANIADAEYDIKDDPIELNVTFFKDTRLIELEFDMRDATGFVAGRIINEQLQNIPNAKCIQVCYSCSSTIIHSFTNEFRHHKLPVFGAKSGRSIRELNTSKVYGQSANPNGIVAIIFASDSLRVFMDNCLGFKEIGVEMMVTQVIGDNIIKTIDHRPATEIYSKYLNVKPNNYFVQNVCEFPLIFHRQECVVARVPSAYSEDGAIWFTSDVAKGERFRLSYGNPDNLFYIINKSIGRLKQFEPEALFIFECGNRVRFLKNLAERETAAFLDYNMEASIGIGYAEMFITPEGDGGALNSALVAVGFKENATSDDSIRACINFIDDDTEVIEDNREYIPFTERILYFLERTSNELDAVNKELGKIAYTDQLTKIYNRWELENKLNELMKLNADSDFRSSLIFMDIDHFKRVNDTYGHDVGDYVLRETVTVIKDNLEPQHIFGRWGGEEFIYILPDTDTKEAQEFAEKLRHQIDTYVYSKVGHITMSFGVTTTVSGDTMDSFVKRADEGLYKAKESGRNRVVVN